MNLLRFYGVSLSEPMALGIGAGMFFSYMPFVRLHGMPVFSFRQLPGAIFSRVMRQLGFKVGLRYFINQDKAMRELDKLLAQGVPTGVVVGVFMLPYFPVEYRFHFNAHNLCIIGKEGDVYTVSDPMGADPVTITYADLKRVRFARGTAAPMGKMYWVKRQPDQPANLPAAVLSGVKLCCNRMLDVPIPYFGVKGIRTLSRKVRNWERKKGARRAALLLAQVVRMLEEIGTGGAGFRYMYAAFLQEASPIVGKPEWRDLSVEMTQIGDLWRAFAADAARKFKRRGDNLCTYDQLADQLAHIADREEGLFTALRKTLK
jgi:hypothetical protein